MIKGLLYRIFKMFTTYVSFRYLETNQQIDRQTNKNKQKMSVDERLSIAGNCVSKNNLS